MRLLVLSDLHLELWREHAPCIDVSVSRPDVVVLAGDINTGAKAIVWATEKFAGIPVVLIAGNHSYYGGKLEAVETALREASAQTDNVHYLNCDEFILGDTRFLGCGLWSDFRLFGAESRQVAMRAAEHSMNDYHRIRLASNGYRKLRAADTANLNAQHKAWLKVKLAEPFDGKTVVVTHMAPSMQSVSSEYSEDIVTACYASNLDDLVAQSELWIHGHMHHSIDISGAEGKGRVVCNPCGYKNKSGGPENFEFDPNLIVEI